MLIEEKNARIKVEQQLLNCIERLVETEERIRRIEGSSRENKNALGQLISHTKNVERAVTMNQQDMMQRKEAQAIKMQELNSKLATMVKSRENLERHSHTMQDEINELQNRMDNQSLEVKDVQGGLRLQNKMFEAQNQKLAKGHQENENGKKISESTKSALEAKILQLQNFVMEVQKPATAARYALNRELYNLPEDYYETYLEKINAGEKISPKMMNTLDKFASEKLKDETQTFSHSVYSTQQITS